MLGGDFGGDVVLQFRLQNKLEISARSSGKCLEGCPGIGLSQGSLDCSMSKLLEGSSRTISSPRPENPRVSEKSKGLSVL